MQSGYRVTEWQLFEPGTIPKYTTTEWYVDRDRAPHLEDGAHSGRLEVAFDCAKQAIEEYGVRSVVDLGCGDGGLLSLIQFFDLSNHIKAWGYDLCPDNVDAARFERKVDARYRNVITDEIEWGDLAICTEMLEHLLNPHAFVRRVAEHSPFIVASSPYIETDQSHYAFHTWAWDQDGYRELLEQAGYTVVRHETWSMFQICLGRKS
jgi:SAM-dependent methyltransferase